MNKYLRKILDSEKEDIATAKKLFKGEKVKLRFSLKDFNPLKILADNWLFTILLIAFLISGFFLGAMSFQDVCNAALAECENDCNEFYGNSDLPVYNFTPELPMLPSELHQEEQYD